MAKLPHQISIQTENGGWRSALALEVPLRKVLQLLKIKDCRWNILLVNDQEMRRLHRRYLRDSTTTDVLTFDMREPGGSAVELETVLCMDEARRRAAELGHSVENELLLYAVHSLLHVRGHDDHTPSEAAQMHQREDELLAAIGIGPVYHWQVNGTQRHSVAARKPKTRGQRNRKSPRGRRS